LLEPGFAQREPVFRNPPWIAVGRPDLRSIWPFRVLGHGDTSIDISAIRDTVPFNLSEGTKSARLLPVVGVGEDRCWRREQAMTPTED
jgi:hypothetical protein